MMKGYYLHNMNRGGMRPPSNFVEAIQHCFKKYATFHGRATRLEYKSFWCFFWGGNILPYILLIVTDDIEPIILLFSLFISLFDNIARWVPPVALLWYRCFMRTNISYHCSLTLLVDYFEPYF